MNSYKLVIPIVFKDIDLVISNIDRIYYNLGASKIVFIGSSDIKQYIEHIDCAEFIDESELYNGLSIQTIEHITKSICNSSVRSGWYFQQFLKMAYCYICQDDYYLVWDSDTIPLRNIDFYSDNGKPFLSYLPFEKFDSLYYETINELLDKKIVIDGNTKSYVVEHMFFNVNIMKSLILQIESNSKLPGTFFFEKILFAITKRNINLSGFSEFETYSSYVLDKYPDAYELRVWNNLRCGKVFLGISPSIASLNWISSVFDSLSIERYDNEWIIFRISVFRKISFKYVYRFTSPLIFINYYIRMRLRSLFKNYIVRFKDKKM